MASNKSNDQLRSLVQGLKTRSPDEVMGEAATRSLMGSVVTAAAATVGLLVVSTLAIFFVVGPPALREKPKPKPVAAAATVSAAPSAPAADPPANEASENAAPGNAATAAVTPKAGTTDNGDPVQAMGIGETKDPDSAPDSLDNRLDDLLQDLE